MSSYTIHVNRARGRVTMTGPVLDPGETTRRLTLAMLRWGRSVARDMQPTVEEMRRQAPRRSGRFRSSLQTRIETDDDSVRVSALADVRYARYVHWSAYTTRELVAEVQRYAGGADAIRPSDYPAWKALAVWWGKHRGERPSRDQMAEAHARRLQHRHGHGAPDERTRGRYVYTELRRRLNTKGNAPEWWRRLRAFAADALEG